MKNQASKYVKQNEMAPGGTSSIEKNRLGKYVKRKTPTKKRRTHRTFRYVLFSSYKPQINPKLFITNTHSVSVTLDSSVAVITTLADRVSSPPMFFAII